MKRVFSDGEERQAIVNIDNYFPQPHISWTYFNFSFENKKKVCSIACI